MQPSRQEERNATKNEHDSSGPVTGLPLNKYITEKCYLNMMTAISHFIPQKCLFTDCWHHYCRNYFTYKPRAKLKCNLSRQKNCLEKIWNIINSNVISFEYSFKILSPSECFSLNFRNSYNFINERKKRWQSHFFYTFVFSRVFMYKPFLLQSHIFQRFLAISRVKPYKTVQTKVKSFLHCSNDEHLNGNCAWCTNTNLTNSHCYEI